MKTPVRFLWIAVGVLFLAVAVVAIYKAGPLLHPKVAQVAPLNPECDLRAGPCEVRFPKDGWVSLEIEPRTIPVVKPLRFDVRVRGMEAKAVEIDFQGVDMNMGFNRPKLKRVGEGHFRGQGTLPVCVRTAMEWEARVLVHTDEGIKAAPFRFITVKPGVPLPGSGGDGDEG